MKKFRNILLLVTLLVLALPLQFMAGNVNGPEGYFSKLSYNSIQYDDAGIRLEVPPQVLRDNTNVKIIKIDPTTIEASDRYYFSKVVDVTLVGQKYAKEANFNKPLRVIFSFDYIDFKRASNLDTSQPIEKFRVGFFDPVKQSWVEMASTVFWDGNSGIVEAPVAQGTGRYALLWAKNPATMSTLGGDKIRLFLNYEEVFSEVAPYIKDGRTMVPLRVIAENLGTKVTWVSAEQPIEIKDNTKTITLKVGSNSAVRDGSSMTLDVAPEVSGGRTFVPLRFIIEALGAEVAWNNQTRTVFVFK